MKKLLSSASLLLLAACNVESTAVGTGGVDVTGDERCPAGVAAVLSDYLSTQIALLDRDGKVLSESFASSGSTQASGLAAPLSGDVVVPSNRNLSGDVVLIDRFGTNVISWIRARSAEVRAQLPIGSGFEANPRDYLALSPDKAYVTRWGENPEPGAGADERGGDVLIVDPAQALPAGVIELPRQSRLPPRPSSITPLGARALVVLERLALDFTSQDPSEIVAIDTETDAIAWHLILTGLKGCGGVAVSPSGATLALACSGVIDSDGNLRDPAESGIVLLDAGGEPPEEIRRISVHDALGFSPQPELSFASETSLLGETQTPFRGRGNNQLFALELGADSFRVLAEAGPNDDGSGRGIVFGGIVCTPGCSDVCLVADQEHSTVRRYSIAGDLLELDAIGLGADSGLPPGSLGSF